MKNKKDLTFKDIYKMPLQFNGDYSIKVFTADSSMAFDFFSRIHNRIYPNSIILGPRDRQTIVEAINGTKEKKITDFTLEYSPDNTMIYAKFPDQTLKREFILVRGWGNLTGIGGHNLDERTATRLQTEFANHIIKQLT